MATGAEGGSGQTGGNGGNATANATGTSVGVADIAATATGGDGGTGVASNGLDGTATATAKATGLTGSSQARAESIAIGNSSEVYRSITTYATTPVAATTTTPTIGTGQALTSSRITPTLTSPPAAPAESQTDAQTFAYGTGSTDNSGNGSAVQGALRFGAIGNLADNGVYTSSVDFAFNQTVTDFSIAFNDPQSTPGAVASGSSGFKSLEFQTDLELDGVAQFTGDITFHTVQAALNFFSSTLTYNNALHFNDAKFTLILTGDGFYAGGTFEGQQMTQGGGGTTPEPATYAEMLAGLVILVLLRGLNRTLISKSPRSAS